MQPKASKGARIAHIGIAVKSISGSLPFLKDILELEEVAVENSDGARIAALSAGESLVELLEPERDESPIGRFLARRGPGIHHVCFSVDDLDATLAKCRDAGITLIDESPRIGAEGKRIAFLHPGSTGGILIELSEH
jgi:methylmalonyl-CoA/ethylmalonyl-CoA epimerase